MAFSVPKRKDPAAAPGDLSSAVASAGIVRTRDLKTWERLPDLKSQSQQRNVVLHPEFVQGKYALYTRPQDSFIEAGKGGGIGWALIDDMTHAETGEETIINQRYYHTIKEVKNGGRSLSHQNAERLASSGPWSERLCCRLALCTVYVYDRPEGTMEDDCGTCRTLTGTGRRRADW